MPKKLNCPSCGANLKPDAYYCDYCGAFFEKPKNTLETDALARFSSAEKKSEKLLNKDENLYKNDNFISTEEIENSRLNSILISYNNIKESSPISSVMFVLLCFFIFIISVTIEMPFIGIFSIIIFVNNINARKEKKQELIKLYEKGAYQAAYQKINENAFQTNNLNFIKQKIMLCYYRLNKKQEAKTLIQLLNSRQHIKDEHIKEVAQKLNVNYEPKTQFNF